MFEFHSSSLNPICDPGLSPGDFMQQAGVTVKSKGYWNAPWCCMELLPGRSSCSNQLLNKLTELRSLLAPGILCGMASMILNWSHMVMLKTSCKAAKWRKEEELSLDVKKPMVRVCRYSGHEGNSRKAQGASMQSAFMDGRSMQGMKGILASNDQWGSVKIVFVDLQFIIFAFIDSIDTRSIRIHPKYSRCNSRSQEQYIKIA